MLKKIGRWGFSAGLAVHFGAGFAPASAGASMLVEDGGSWLQIVAEGSLKAVDPDWAKARVWVDGQSLWDRDWDHWYQGVLRAAIGYSISEHATVWAGYSWVPTQNMGKLYVSEQDVWPAFRYILPTSIGTFTFRTMLESNFLNGDEVRVRPRQLIRFIHPLAFQPHLSLVAWDEIFVRLNDTRMGGTAGIDQNRAFIGLGWTFNAHVHTELGYVNQYLDDFDHVNATVHHLIMTSLFLNF